MLSGSRLESTSRIFSPSSMVSNYNLGICEGCNKLITRGQEVTRVIEELGMKLRYRTHLDGSFYRPATGARIVHKECRILDSDNVYLWTDWAGTLQSRRDIEEEEIIDNKLRSNKGLIQKIYSNHGHITYNTDTLEAYNHSRKEFGYYNFNKFTLRRPKEKKWWDSSEMEFENSDSENGWVLVDS